MRSGCFQRNELLTGLGPARQLDRTLHEPALSSRAIFLDRLLDSRKALGGIDSIDGCHSTTVL